MTATPTPAADADAGQRAADAIHNIIVGFRDRVGPDDEIAALVLSEAEWLKCHLATTPPSPDSAVRGSPVVATVIFGPCDHQWGYMTTTGCMSCVRCREFRNWDDPETIRVRAQYDAALATPPAVDGEEVQP